MAQRDSNNFTHYDDEHLEVVDEQVVYKVWLERLASLERYGKVDARLKAYDDIDFHSALDSFESFGGLGEPK